MSLGSDDETKLESIEEMKLMWGIKKENKVINLLARLKRRFVNFVTPAHVKKKKKPSQRRVSRQPKIGLLPGTINTSLKLKFHPNQTNLAERERPRRGFIVVFLLSKACRPPPHPVSSGCENQIEPFQVPDRRRGSRETKQNAS